MEDVVRIGLPLGECVGLQHRQSWLRFPPNTDEEVHSCWAVNRGFTVIICPSLANMKKNVSRLENSDSTPFQWNTFHVSTAILLGLLKHSLNQIVNTEMHKVFELKIV